MLGENRPTMMERPAFPSWFWLLLCIASFAASLLTWNGPRPAARQLKAQVNESSNVGPVATVKPAPSNSDAASAPEPPSDIPAASPAADRARSASPRVIPVDTAGGTKVLRCTVRGRVTYIDPSSSCPDGAAGKITVLPR
jgi:hypothetical protein